MSKATHFEQFSPAEQGRFLTALKSAQHHPERFQVAKMEISPPLMPGEVTGLVTVKLISSGVAFSYEDAVGNSWLREFVEDLEAGRFADSTPAAIPAPSNIGAASLPLQRDPLLESPQG